MAIQKIWFPSSIPWHMEKQLACSSMACRHVPSSFFHGVDLIFKRSLILDLTNFLQLGHNGRIHGNDFNHKPCESVVIFDLEN